MHDDKDGGYGGIMLCLDDIRHPRYQENSDGMPGGCLPCVVCGKPIHYQKSRHRVYMHDDGQHILTPDEMFSMEDSSELLGQMGWQPVGSDCFRKHRAELDAYDVPPVRTRKESDDAD